MQEIIDLLNEDLFILQRKNSQLTLELDENQLESLENPSVYSNPTRIQRQMSLLKVNELSLYDSQYPNNNIFNCFDSEQVNYNEIQLTNFPDQISDEQKQQFKEIAFKQKNEEIQVEKQPFQRFFKLKQNNNLFCSEKKIKSYTKTKIFQTLKRNIQKQEKTKLINKQDKQEEKQKRKYICKLINVESPTELSKAKKNIQKYATQAIIKYFLNPQQYNYFKQYNINKEELYNSIRQIAKKESQLITIKQLQEEFKRYPLFEIAACLFIFKESRRWALTGNQLNFQLYLQSLKKIIYNCFKVNI